jgi:hypothetical protein
VPRNPVLTAMPAVTDDTAGHRRARRVFAGGLLAIAATLLLLSGRAAGAPTHPSAHAANTMALNENITLHLSSRHGLSRVYEQGTGTGTFHCSVTLNLTITSVAQVNAEFVVSAPGGTLTGRGSAIYHVSGTTGFFHGAFSISHGTGRYAHTTGSGLTAKGTISRSTYAVSMQVSGTVRL